MAAEAKRYVQLSGGIGAGKSTVAGLLADRGAEVISTDRLGHELFEPGSAVHAEVVARWPGVARARGLIDRSLLGAIVFADPAELAALEALTHPEIRASALRLANASPASVVVVEIPLVADFLGPGWRRVLVHAAAAIRRERLLERGHDADDVAARMAAQPSDEEWLDWAEFVVDNSADPAALAAEVASLWEWIGANPPEPSGPSRRVSPEE